MLISFFYIIYNTPGRGGSHTLIEVRSRKTKKKFLCVILYPKRLFCLQMLFRRLAGWVCTYYVLCLLFKQSAALILILTLLKSIMVGEFQASSEIFLK